MSTISLNSTGSDALQLSVTYSWDDVVECDVSLIFSHFGDGEHVSTGGLTAANVWLSASKLLALQKAIMTWLESPEFRPSAFHGTYDLAYYDKKSELKFTFVAGANDTMSVNVEYGFGSVQGLGTIETDQSSMRILASQIRNSVPSAENAR